MIGVNIIFKYIADNKSHGHEKYFCNKDPFNDHPGIDPVDQSDKKTKKKTKAAKISAIFVSDRFIISSIFILVIMIIIIKNNLLATIFLNLACF